MNIEEQIEKHLSEPVIEAPYEEFNIDWPDDPAELIEELNQELNFRLRRLHSICFEDGDKLKKDIQTRYPDSYMFEGYGNCIVEITPEGNICYDFIKMIWKSAYRLNKCYCFRPDFTCFSNLEGLKELCEYLCNVDNKVMEDKIEPMFVINGYKTYWSCFTYTDYGNPYFDDEDLSPAELERKYLDEYDLPEDPAELAVELGHYIEFQADYLISEQGIDISDFSDYQVLSLASWYQECKWYDAKNAKEDFERLGE